MSARRVPSDRNTRPLLGPAKTLLSAFPHIARIEVRVVEENAYVGWRRDRVFQNDVPAAIPCSNPRCREGGYDIANLIYFVAEGRKTNDEITIRCNGHEGSPKGRRRGDPCTNRACITATADFSDAAPTSAS
jgi:hypothetical protein